MLLPANFFAQGGSLRTFFSGVSGRNGISRSGKEDPSHENIEGFEKAKQEH